MTTYVKALAKRLGLKTVDAKRSLRIEVSEQDIAGARVKNSKCCAFARASKRDLGAKAAFFFRSTAWLQFDDRMERFTLPPSVQKEIVAFDRSGEAMPGVYQLSRPHKSRTMKAYMKRSAKRKGEARRGDGKRKGPFVHRATNVRSAFEPRDAR